MADSILRLKVESAEYDSKLKKASQGLQHYIDECRKAGGTLAVVEDDTLAFVKALGEMPTVAQGGTQSLREMTRSITDLTMQYRSLTDEEKNSPFGQAMAASIQTLTSRAGQARDAIDDVQATIKHAASDTRVFDQITSAAGLATASFQTLQGASKLLGIDIGNDVEVIAKLQAAMAVTNGLTQIQTALQKESALMQGIQTIQTKALAAAQALNATNTTAATVAQGAFNAVAKANPYVLLASAIIAVGGAVLAYARHTKEATEETQQSEAAMKRAKAAADSYRKSMSSSFADMMGKYESLKRAWLSLADTHQKQQWINDNKKAFEELGLSINTVKSAEDVFEANTGKVVDSFRRRAQSAALAARMVDLYQQKMDLELQAKELYNDKRVSAYDVVGNRVTGSFTRDAGADTFNEGRYGMNNQGQYYFTTKGAKEYNEQLFTSNKQLKDMNDRYKEINGQIDETNRKLTQLESSLTPIKGKGGDKAPIIPIGSIADLTKKLQDLKTAQDLVTNTDDWVRYQQQIKHVEYQINALKGEWERGLQATFDFGASEQFKKMADAGREMLRMFGDGNVDLLARPMVDAAELVKKGWKDAGDGIATVFSYQRQIEDSTGRSIEILVTPILPDGTVLSEDELNQYIDDKIWGANDILAADDKGIIIKVGASEDGSMGETLHDLQAIYYMTDKEIDLKVDGDRLKSVTSQMADYIRTGQLGGLNLNDTIKVTVDDTEALAKLSEIQGVTIADKTVMVTAHNAAALAQLAQVQDVTLADKSVTVSVNSAEAYNEMLQLSRDMDGTTVTFNLNTDDTEALKKLSEIQGITIADKSVTVSVDSDDAYNELLQLSKDIDGSTVTFNVNTDDTEALAKLSEIQGVTIADKTVMVTAHNAAALAQLAQVQDVTLADKSVTVSAQDKDALTKLSEIQGITIDDKNVSVSVDSAEAYNELLQLSKDMDGTTVTFNVKPEINRSIGKSITTSAGLSEYISGLKKQLQDADFGSDLYQSLTEKLADVTMLENLVKEALSVGLGTALFDIADEAGQDFWDRVISPEGVENADWQAIADAINRKRKELGLDALTLDFKTGSVGKGPSIESSDTIQKMTSGMSQVSSGLTQLGVKLPDGVNKLVSSMQGMTSIIQGVQTLLSVFGSSTMSVEIASQNANTSALMANTSALIANSASNNTDAVIEGVKGVMGIFSGGAAGKHNGGVIHAATGAIVPGRQFSGDNIPALLDSGELILNRAQQGNLASQFQDNGSQSVLPVLPYVTGQTVFLGINNHLKAAGYGELVTTKMLRQMGIR